MSADERRLELGPAAGTRLYELINPSDPYTFRAASREAAVLAAISLATGFGVQEIGSEWSAGPFVLCAAGEFAQWWQAEFGSDWKAWQKSHRREIVEALESFAIGNANTRLDYEAALAAIDDPEKREAFRLDRHDRRRTSTNNIGRAAWNLANMLAHQAVIEERLPEPRPSPPAPNPYSGAADERQ